MVGRHIRNWLSPILDRLKKVCHVVARSFSLVEFQHQFVHLGMIFRCHLFDRQPREPAPIDKNSPPVPLK